MFCNNYYRKYYYFVCLVEKYRENNKKLWMLFIGLEEVYDRVSREIFKWALIRK